MIMEEIGKYVDVEVRSDLSLKQDISQYTISPEVQKIISTTRSQVGDILNNFNDNTEESQIDYSKWHRGTLIFWEEEFDIISIEPPLLSVFTEEWKKYFDKSKKRFLNISPVAFFWEECPLDIYRRTWRYPQELKN